MGSRSRTLAAAGTLLIGATLGAVPQASAVPVTSAAAAAPGTAGYLNMWVDDNYETCAWSRLNYDSNFGNDWCGAGTMHALRLDDKLSSFVNKTSDWWVLYEDKDYGGARVCVRPNSHDANIGNDTSYEDDISSVERRGTTKPANCTDTTGTAN
ncbi:peptidase inhibitor family I36 protein [Pimelobacter simplex]|uniref:peptidase inhibitor family I36 protein n=1 Tax=Nocardioides simplex TaxID=2045 RepID=UPI0021504C86|nr:peptidase inhibitor family I36 protein [Pimelobacter simplex]UUW87728.1 peptidase inhibitor family I36 protein [Pimelobacter simplex]UUW97233.1 peptidase inhibitor family I36 protein [Pimelobacter simplex]